MVVEDAVRLSLLETACAGWGVNDDCLSAMEYRWSLQVPCSFIFSIGIL